MSFLSRSIDPTTTARQMTVEGETVLRRKKRVRLYAALSVLAVVLILVGIKAGQIGAMIGAGKKFVPPPESVTSAKAESSQWQGSRAAIGSLVAVRGVVLGAEVPGRIEAIHFDSGSSVKKGTVLVQLDISTEKAQLESADAAAALSRLTLNRTRALSSKGGSTRAELEAAEANAQAAHAAVSQARAALAKKTIIAPFDGRVAIRQVELGQIVSPGTPIASLQSVTPIHAEFSLPQQSLADVKVGQKVKLKTDAFPAASWEGEVSVVNPEVDVATRNVRVRATVQNDDGRLSPGMFANVELLSDESHAVTVIPATGVMFAPYGDSIYTIETKKGPDGKEALTARQKFVRLGARRGDFVEVLSGLSAGETVVSSGAFKLRNGMAVQVNNNLAPTAQLAPTPAEQ